MRNGGWIHVRRSFFGAVWWKRVCCDLANICPYRSLPRVAFPCTAQIVHVAQHKSFTLRVTRSLADGWDWLERKTEENLILPTTARLLPEGSTWWFDPTRGFPARPFGTTFTAVPRRVGRRPDSGRFVGSVEISGFHGFRLHGFKRGVWILASVVRRV